MCRPIVDILVNNILTPIVDILVHSVRREAATLHPLTTKEFQFPQSAVSLQVHNILTPIVDILVHNILTPI